MKLEPTKTSTGGINFYVLTAMFAGILIYAIVNWYEPQIDSQADIFEIIYSLSQFVTGSLGLAVARKYWGSKVFGRAYLALGIGFVLEGIASSLFTVLQMQGVPLPYPGWPDLFVAPYFFLLLYHVISCTRYFKKKLDMRDKLIIITVPVVVNIIYILAVFNTFYIPGSVPDLLSKQATIGGQTFEVVPLNSLQGSTDSYQHITIDGVTYVLVPLQLSSTTYPQLPDTSSPVDLVPLALSHIIIEPNVHDSTFWPPFFAGLFYNVITTIILGWAIIATTVYRSSILGNAWGLLLLGIGLVSIADIIYDFSVIYAYDRTNPYMAIWVFGRMIIAYALYVHMKNL